ncbi:phosphatase PAP2 family protein [Saccharothrix syringae]|uniref:phosphatase PAP2 family protein n=1 Tax=Saccharothrix syringae TaxID=103733 RepID=UPI00068CD058|nr:phosphatase PAP2 family protein [Saccharothrix syringae]
MTTSSLDRRTVVTAEKFAVRSAVSLIAASTAGTAFFAVLALVWSGWAPVREADQALSALLNRWVSGSGTTVAVLGAVTRLGDTATLVGVCTLAVAWLLVRRRPWVAVHVVVTALGGGVLGVVVKELVGRLRPLVEVEVARAEGFSFPSGHTLGATVTYGVLLLVFASLPRGRVALTWLTVAVVLAVGLSRVALGVHYATDVLGGWLLGLLWLALTTEVFRRWRRDRGMPDVPVSHGLVPEAAGDLEPAPERVHVPGGAWRAAARLLVAWALLLVALFALGSWLTAAGPDVPPAWDRAVVEWFAGLRTPERDALLVPIGDATGTGPVVAAAVVVCVLALAGTRDWRPVLLVVLGLVGEVTLFLLITSVVERARPASRIPSDVPPTSAFPSGHVAASLVLGAAVVLLVRRAASGWWRVPVLVVAAAVPAVVAAQRLYTGLHHPTDVLGSVLLALVWIAVVHATTYGSTRTAEGRPRG